MWWNHNLGNVRERHLGNMDGHLRRLMAGLKARPRRVGGRCGACQYFDICGGNTRVRAWQVSSDPWAEDPGCYLADGGLGIDMDGHRTCIRKEIPEDATGLFHRLVFPFLLIAFFPCSGPGGSGTRQLYTQHCASCHGTDRLGLMGPALLPENLARLKRAGSRGDPRQPASRADARVSRHSQAGRDPATGRLDHDPGHPRPKWGEGGSGPRVSCILRPARSRTSRSFRRSVNLFVVVEGGDHHVTILMATGWSRSSFSFPVCLASARTVTPDGRYVLLRLA